MIIIFTQFKDAQHFHRNIQLCLGIACQYLDGILESNSRNCDVMLTVRVTPNEALPLYYITWDKHRKDAWGYEQLYEIVRIALRTIVRNKYKG